MLTTMGGAAALAPVAMRTGPVTAAPVVTPPTEGSLVTLRTPIRLFDSRTDITLLGGSKIAAEEAIIVTVAVPGETRFLSSAFLNVTVTETEGAGFLRVFGTDSSGTQPQPRTSNVNWSEDGQTLANLALTGVGSEAGVEIFCGGLGRTHVVVDLQGYVPFELNLPF
jgi:hypothetical protein